MDYETSKGILRMLFDELLEELPPEALERIAKTISEKIHEVEVGKVSHIRKLLDIQELERDADIAQRQGFIFTAMMLQNQAESIRFSL